MNCNCNLEIEVCICEETAEILSKIADAKANLARHWSDLGLLQARKAKEQKELDAKR